MFSEILAWGNFQGPGSLIEKFSENQAGEENSNQGSLVRNVSGKLTRTLHGDPYI